MDFLDLYRYLFMSVKTTTMQSATPDGAGCFGVPCSSVAISILRRELLSTEATSFGDEHRVPSDHSAALA